jgi:uncharacterized protein YkwD
MKFTKILLLAILALLFSSCAEESKSDSDYTITADAGEDKRVKINETITILGKGTTTDKSELSYLWEKGELTLATTALFSYTPTVVGTDTLTFTVQHSDGSFVQDRMNVVVTETKVLSSTIPTISQSQIDEYLMVVNRARSKEQNCGSQGIFPATDKLIWSEQLYKSAYEHTQDLVASQTFSHTGSGTESDWTGTVLGKASILTERVETYGYAWSFIGENLGAGTVIDTAEKMVEGWLASEHHCANLMSPNFTEMGMVLITDESSHYTHYWTQNFGKPR